MLGAAITQIVTVYRGYHHVFQAHIGNGGSQIDRLIHIKRIRPAMAHIAERTTAGTDIAHDHERCRTATKTLTDVRAAGLFTHGVQLVLAQLLFDVVNLR